jgi:hypothetical protein
LVACRNSYAALVMAPPAWLSTITDVFRRPVVRTDYALRIDMTKPKPKDQLQKRGRKSDFRPEYILIAKACARFGAIEEEIADELHINHATLDNWKKKTCSFAAPAHGRI